MTQTDALDATVRDEPSDPLRETVLSASALAAAAIAYAAATWRLDELDPRSSSLWLPSVLFVGSYGAAVVVRARDASRRRRSLVVLAGLLAAMVGPVVWMVNDDQFLWDHAWVLNASNHVSPLLVLAAWGTARRRGRWWWVGLAPAFAVALLWSHLMSSPASAAWEWPWQLLWILDTAVLLLGSLCCWLVDVLTTRRFRARGTLVA